VFAGVEIDDASALRRRRLGCDQVECLSGDEQEEAAVLDVHADAAVAERITRPPAPRTPEVPTPPPLARI